jgi:hypothetical protein
MGYTGAAFVSLFPIATWQVVLLVLLWCAPQ